MSRLTFLLVLRFHGKLPTAAAPATSALILIQRGVLLIISVAHIWSILLLAATSMAAYRRRKQGIGSSGTSARMSSASDAISLAA